MLRPVLFLTAFLVVIGPGPTASGFGRRIFHCRENLNVCTCTEKAPLMLHLYVDKAQNGVFVDVWASYNNNDVTLIADKVFNVYGNNPDKPRLQYQIKNGPPPPPPYWRVFTCGYQGVNQWVDHGESNDQATAISAAQAFCKSECPAYPDCKECCYKVIDSNTPPPSGSCCQRFTPSKQ
jgi:hypothetical protein